MEQLAWVSIGVAALCSCIIAVHELRHPQKMAVMNAVWPLSALYLSVFALWAYFAVGARRAAGTMQEHDTENAMPARSLTFMEVAVATSHCGAGCALADIAIEFLIAGASLTLFGRTLWASFVYGLIAAWLVGVAFQYFSIQPMRHLPPQQALATAIKADTLSILAFQTGMYTFMAFDYFVLAPHPRPDAFDARFWLTMQIAMVVGFATAYPMNFWLLKKGFKERM